MVFLFLSIFLSITAAQDICYEPCGCFNTDPPFNTRPLPADWREFPIKWRLFPKNGKVNNPIEISFPDVVKPPEFDSLKPTVFTIHGWTNDGDALNLIRDAYLDNLDYNLIVVDWEPGAAQTLYPRAASQTRVTGACTAYMARQLVQDLSSVHCVGHSLGAHTCGYMGKNLKDDSNRPLLGRITGLDPAGPLFSTEDIAVRLDKSDALFVDSIHTDAGVLGIGGHNTDVDFFPNRGYEMPGCGEGCREEDCPLCSTHQIVVNYYAASITHKNMCDFLAFPCDSEDAIDQGGCASCSGSDCQMMGYYAADMPGRGTYYLQTEAKYPYCAS